MKKLRSIQMVNGWLTDTRASTITSRESKMPKFLATMKYGRTNAVRGRARKASATMRITAPDSPE